MNLMVGTIGTDFDRLLTRVEPWYPGLARIQSDGHIDTPIAAGRSGGAALGLARDGDVVCVLRGFLHLPLPDWSAGHPVDSADRAAGYLLERYRRLGTGFLDGVWGRFATAVFDGVAQTLHLGTDPYGSVDVFVHERPGSITFSTKLAALARALGSDAAVDRSLEDFFLLYGFHPWKQTVYRGMRSIAGATVATWSGDRLDERPVAVSKPWEGDLDALHDGSVDEARVITLLHDAFMRSLEDQVGSDQRVAVLLGGFDSALVAAGLRELGKDVETYSYHYDDERYNQPHTDTVSNYLGTKHHWVRITPDDIGAGLRTYADNFDTPTNWPNYVIQTLRVAQRIRDDGFELCCSGDGCDYLFYGYPLTYRRARLLGAVSLPRAIGRPLVGLLERPALERALGRPYQVGMGVLRSWQRPYPARGYLTFKIFDEMSLRQLRGGNTPEHSQSVESILSELSAPFSGLEPARLAYMGKHALAPYRIKMNGSTDSTGLLITAPYLHQRMQTLAHSIPEELLRPEGAQRTTIGKYALTRMADVYGLLPHEVIHQPKLGAVDAPLVHWYAGPLRPTLLELLEGLPFRPDTRYVDALLRPKRAEALFARLISGTTSNVVTVTHAISLLATYAAFTGLVKQ